MRTNRSDVLVKMIGENHWLTADLKQLVYGWGRDLAVDYFKTYSGYTPIGATVEDVRLMREIAGGQVKIKASGGINQFNYPMFLREGIDRIGMSRADEILENFEPVVG